MSMRRALVYALLNCSLAMAVGFVIGWGLSL